MRLGISQDCSVLTKLCEKEASADCPGLCVFCCMVAGLLTDSPVYAVRATIQAMSTIRISCLLLVEVAVVSTNNTPTIVKIYLYICQKTQSNEIFSY